MTMDRPAAMETFVRIGVREASDVGVAELLLDFGDVDGTRVALTDERPGNL
jgi:hypothetical protein